MYCQVHMWSRVGRQHRAQHKNEGRSCRTANFALVLLFREHFGIHRHLTVDERHVDARRPPETEALRWDKL